MTVFEYMQQLPQPLFEATLMGLMGIPIDPVREAVFHDWMNSPYEETFKTDAVISADTINMPSTDELLALLGREIQKLSPEQQEQMRNAMKNYCEVCDCINQNLADAQKE